MQLYSIFFLLKKDLVPLFVHPTAQVVMFWHGSRFKVLELSCILLVFEELKINHIALWLRFSTILLCPLPKVNSNLLGYISKPNQACCPGWFGVNSLFSMGLFIIFFLPETSVKESSFHKSRIVQWAFCEDKPLKQVLW